jgi:hypothetical protein
MIKPIVSNSKIGIINTKLLVLLTLSIARNNKRLEIPDDEQSPQTQGF